MTYTHLTPNELVMIEAYFHQETPVAIVAKQLKRGRQTIYNVYNFLSFFLLRKKNTLKKIN
ncbi:hypothetical protein EfmAA55_28580 (plasmid) [Enterococcus faecium]|nr:hypothetical protein EfmAA55_28580 [Enterococcus faecium]